MKKSLLSILLSICMVFPMIVEYLPTEAAETEVSATATEETDAAETDAYGINVDVSDFDEEESIQNNPYGTDDWVTLFSVSELYLSYGTSDSRTASIYNYNTDLEEGSIGSVTSPDTSNGGSSTNVSALTSSKNSAEYYITDTAEVTVTKEEALDEEDAYGNTTEDVVYTYVVNYVYETKNDSLMLFLTDSNGNSVGNSVTVSTKSYVGYLDDSECFYNSSYLSVASGDFDGDGVDSIIVYVPEMKSSSVQPAIYQYDVNPDTLALENKTKIADVYTLLGVSNLSNYSSKDGNARRNAPAVQLLASDTDKDNIEELIITAGLHNTSSGDLNDLQSKMFLYDYLTDSSSWSKTYSLDTSSYSYNDAERLRWASSSVGNLIVSDEDGVDFPEIITAGWTDTSDDDDADVTDDIGSYITYCTKTTKNGSTSVGTYSSAMIQVLTTDDDAVSEYTAGGHDAGDDIQPLLQIAVGLADGTANAASVLISDTVYSLNSISMKLSEEFRDSYFNDKDNGVDESIISTNEVQDAIAANFDGNYSGREQFVFSSCLKRSGRNDYFYEIYTYQKDDDGNWSAETTGWLIYEIGNTYLSLCAIDIDSDSIIAQCVGAEYTYTDPYVLAILESTPYYEEIENGNIGVSETSYGLAKESGESTTNAETLGAEFIIGYEVSFAFILEFEAGIEATIENGYTYEATQTTTVEYSIDYQNTTGENMVIVYRRPVTSWLYRMKDTDDTFNISQEGTLAYSMMTVEEYNEVAEIDGRDVIDEDMLCDPGDPYSYRSSMELQESASNIMTFGSTASYKKDGATSTQEITYIESEDVAYEYEIGGEFEAWGVVGGLKTGDGINGSYSNTSTTISASSISKKGTVECISEDGYTFEWTFATWTTELNDIEVPVLGYIVTNVTGAPTPPKKINVENVTSDSVTLSWTLGAKAGDEFRIYRIYADGSREQVGVVDGTDTSCTISGLEPNTTYTYGITAYKEASSSAKVKGESVLSQEVIFTTLPDGDISVEITSPNDTTVSVGDSAVFNASIIVDSDDYIATNYQWQKLDSSGSWENLSNDSSTVSGATTSKLTISNVAKEDDGNEYRCILKVSYEGIDSIISYYSNPAELHVDSVDIDLDFTVTGSNSGSGTLENPYTGLSNTSTVSSTDDGTTLTLTAVATKKNGTGAKDAVVDFKIYNLEDKTTNTVTVVADSSGKATTTWTAPKAGSYGLRAVVRSDDVYDQTLSDMFYYEASKVYDEDTTEYRLRLQQDGSAVSNIDYGESVSLVLQSRTVKAGSTDTSGSWSNVSGTVVFTVADDDTETTIYTGQNGSSASYEPASAGAVTFNAYLGSTDSDIVATKSMQVNKVDITITPTWAEYTIPTSEDDVTLSVDEGLVGMTATEADAFLKENILDITCSYFDLDEQENAYGKYTVSLSYKNYEDKDSTGYQELTTFKNNYNVTLESNSFTLKKESAVVTYSSSENGKLRGYYTDNRYNLTSGSAVTKGTTLYFTATPSDGYAVESWEINGTTYTSSSTLPEGMEWSASGKQLAIESFDTTNHVGSDGTLNVVVNFGLEEEISYGEEDPEATTGTDTETGSGTETESGTTTESESTTTAKTSFKAKGTAKKTSVKLNWNKVSGADGYIIYGKKVGSNSKMKQLTVIESGSKTTWTHKSLKKASTYKYRIKAYKLVNGKKQIIGVSNTMKLATTGGKYTNVSRLKATSKVTMKLGKTKKLSVKTVLAEKGKSLSKHTKSLTWSTSNSSVVKVTSSGKLKAVGKGTCKVYITSASGAYAMIRVTVK